MAQQNPPPRASSHLKKYVMAAAIFQLCMTIVTTAWAFENTFKSSGVRKLLFILLLLVLCGRIILDVTLVIGVQKNEKYLLWRWLKVTRVLVFGVAIMKILLNPGEIMLVIIPTFVMEFIMLVGIQYYYNRLTTPAPRKPVEAQPQNVMMHDLAPPNPTMENPNNVTPQISVLNKVISHSPNFFPPCSRIYFALNGVKQCNDLLNDIQRSDAATTSITLERANLPQ